MSVSTEEIVKYINKKSSPNDCYLLLDDVREERSDDFIFVVSPGDEEAGPICMRVDREYCYPNPDPSTPIIERTEIYWILEHEAYTYMVIEGVLLVIVFLIILYRLKKKRKKVK